MGVIYIHDKSKIFQMWWQLMFFHHKFIFSACSLEVQYIIIHCSIWGMGWRNAHQIIHNFKAQSEKPSPLVHLHEGRRRMHKRRPTCKSDYDMVSILHLDCKCKQCNPTALKQGNKPWCAYNRQGSSGCDGSKRWAAKSRLLLFSDAHTGSHTHTTEIYTMLFIPARRTDGVDCMECQHHQASSSLVSPLPCSPILHSTANSYLSSDRLVILSCTLAIIQRDPDGGLTQ